MKPIEWRTIKSEYGHACGKLSLFMELINEKNKKSPPHDITPLTRMKCELRAIVYKAQAYIFKDGPEKCNDLYIVAGPQNLNENI